MEANGSKWKQREANGSKWKQMAHTLSNKVVKRLSMDEEACSSWMLLGGREGLKAFADGRAIGYKGQGKNSSCEYQIPPWKRNPTDHK
jgi:hypothetical protein